MEKSLFFNLLSRIISTKNIGFLSNRFLNRNEGAFIKDLVKKAEFRVELIF